MTVFGGSEDPSDQCSSEFHWGLRKFSTVGFSSPGDSWGGC